METVRSYKFGSTQSEVGFSAATSAQSEVVNMVQYVSLRQNMTPSAITQAQPEFAKETRKSEGCFRTC